MNPVSVRELLNLWVRFKTMDDDNDGLITPTDMMNCRHVRDVALYQQVIKGFFRFRSATTKDEDDSESKQPDVSMDFESFVKLMATFRAVHSEEELHSRTALNSLAEKLCLVFKVFDVSHRNKIVKEELAAIIKATGYMNEDIKNRKPSQIAHSIMNQVDHAGTQSLNYLKFCELLDNSGVNYKLTTRF